MIEHPTPNQEVLIDAAEGYILPYALERGELPIPGMVVGPAGTGNDLFVVAVPSMFEAKLQLHRAQLFAENDGQTIALAKFAIGEAVLVDQGLPGRIASVRKVYGAPGGFEYEAKPDDGSPMQECVPEYNLMSPADQFHEEPPSDRRAQIKDALDHILDINTEETCGAGHHPPGAAVKWPQAIGSAIGSVSMAAAAAKLTRNVKEIERVEAVRDRVLWDLAVLLGLDVGPDADEVELTPDEMADRLVNTPLTLPFFYLTLPFFYLTLPFFCLTEAEVKLLTGGGDDDEATMAAIMSAHQRMRDWLARETNDTEESA